MHSCIFYPCSTRWSDSLHILSFACQATLLRVGWRGGFSYCLVPAKTGTVGFYPLYFLFYNVYLNTLGICLRWLLRRVRSVQFLEGSTPFLMVLLFFDVSDIFRGVYKVVRDSLQSLSRNLASMYRSISLGIYALVSGSLSVLQIVWLHFSLGALACPSVSPWWKRYSKLLEKMLCFVLENILPALFVSCWRRSRRAA